MIRHVVQMSVFLLVGLATAQQPDAFQDYVDGEVREVEISENLAMKSCLASDSTVGSLFDSAYNKCFGDGYDWEQLAEENENSGEYGVSDSFQEREVCFYKAIGWTDGTSLNVDVIKGNMEGMEATIKSDFEGKVNQCQRWTPSNSRFRVKRDDNVQESSLIKRIRRQAEGENSPSKKECKKNPDLKGCKESPSNKQGGDNSPSKKECKKNPDLEGCKESPSNKQGGDNSPSKKECKKNPDLEGCKESPSPKQGGDNSPSKKECKENPDLKGCKESPSPKQGGDNSPSKKECIKNPDLEGCKGRQIQNEEKVNGKICKNDMSTPGCKEYCQEKPKKCETGSEKQLDKPTDQSAQPNGVSGGISNNLYEQLWCSDLAFEQALQQCVENKINP